MSRNEAMRNPVPTEQDAVPELGAHESPAEVVRSRGGHDDDDRTKSLAELEATHADLLAEGDARSKRLAKSLQKEIDSLRKELGKDGRDSGIRERSGDAELVSPEEEARMERKRAAQKQAIKDEAAIAKTRTELGSAETARNMADIQRMQKDRLALEARGEWKAAEPTTDMTEDMVEMDVPLAKAEMLESLGELEDVGKGYAAKPEALRDIVMSEKGEASPYATRDLTGEIKESPEAMRERAVKELEADLKKGSDRIADLKRALTAIGDQPMFEGMRKTLDAELGDRYREQGLAVLNIDALRKTTLREVTDAEIDAAVDAMTVDKNAEYQEIIRQLAMEEEQEDLAKLPDKIGAAIDAVRTDLGEEAVRSLKDKRAREALRNITPADIEKAVNALRLSITQEHAITPEQVKSQLVLLGHAIASRETGPAGVKALEAELKKEHGYDPEDPKNTVGLGSKVRHFFKGLGNPRFRALKQVYDFRLKELGMLKDEVARLSDPDAARRADTRTSLRQQRGSNDQGVHITGLPRPK